MHAHDRIYVRYEEAKPLIKEGDLFLYRTTNWYSFFLKKITRGEYIHIGLASWHNGTSDKPASLETIEFHGFRGGGVVINVDNLFPEYSEKIDVYRPNQNWEKIIFCPHSQQCVTKNTLFDGLSVTNTMRGLTGLPYGWKRIWWFFKTYILFGRLFYNLEDLTSDEERDIIYPVCSTAIAYSFSTNGFDLVHERSDEFTTPSDIPLSSTTNYLFTIT